MRSSAAAAWAVVFTVLFANATLAWAQLASRTMNYEVSPSYAVGVQDHASLDGLHVDDEVLCLSGNKALTIALFAFFAGGLMNIDGMYSLLIVLI